MNFMVLPGQETSTGCIAISTVSMERFAGLNFYGFDLMKFSSKYFQGALHLKYLAKQ